MVVAVAMVVAADVCCEGLRAHCRVHAALCGDCASRTAGEAQGPSATETCRGAPTICAYGQGEHAAVDVGCVEGQADGAHDQDRCHQNSRCEAVVVDPANTHDPVPYTQLTLPTNLPE